MAQQQHWQPQLQQPKTLWCQWGVVSLSVEQQVMTNM
jgi:hypothetical protein